MPPRLRSYPGGYYVPQGWRSLVMPMLDRLEEIAAEIHACTEMFGGLKVIVLEPSDQAIGIYRPTAERCNWTCQDCGGPGVLRSNSHGYLKTCCDKHFPMGTHRQRIKDFNWEHIRLGRQP